MAIESNALVERLIREGAANVGAGVEGCSAPHDYISRHPGSTQCPVGETTARPVTGAIIRNHQKQIIVAIWSGLAAGTRPKQEHLLGPIGSHQPPHDLLQLLIARQGYSHTRHLHLIAIIATILASGRPKEVSRSSQDGFR
jgi:hypothetical protein